MKKKGFKILIVFTGIIIFFPLISFCQQGLVNSKQSITSEADSQALQDKKANWVVERDENIKKLCEDTVLIIKAEDKDTGDLPEAGFFVDEPGENIDRLINLKERAIDYLTALLKETKNGYNKAKIVKAFQNFSPDQKVIDALIISLKDKSSEVKFLSGQLLGKIGDAKVIPRLTSLLYDAYYLRKDVYPLRKAGREAIDLIKFREELNKLQTDEEKAKKLVELIKEKALSKQDYFCEYAAEAFINYISAKEIVWQELANARLQAGKISQLNTKVYGYLLEAASVAQDERVLLLIDESLGNPSLYWTCIKVLNRISPGKLTDILLKEPVNSDLAKLILNLIENESKKKNILEYNVTKQPINKIQYDEYIAKVKKMLILNRDESVYKDIAEIFAYGLNDYETALEYTKLYEDVPDYIVYDKAYVDLVSKCLAGAGKFSEAGRINPMLNVSSYIIYAPLIDELNKKTPENDTYLCRKLQYLYRFYEALEQYKNAQETAKSLISLKGSEIKQETAEQMYKYCDDKIKEKVNEIFDKIEAEGEKSLNLEIKADKDFYNTGEQVKVKVLLHNNSPASVYTLNDNIGNLGFDFIVMKNGCLVKILKKNLDGNTEEGQLAQQVLEIKANESIEADIVVFSEQENTVEGQYEVIFSYIGGHAVKENETDWIKELLASSEIIIKIRK